MGGEGGERRRGKKEESLVLQRQEELEFVRAGSQSCCRAWRRTFVGAEPERRRGHGSIVESGHRHEHLHRATVSVKSATTPPQCEPSNHLALSLSSPLVFM